LTRSSASVEPLEGTTLQAADLSAYLRLHLADYKVPRIIAIGRKLPREESGEILKRRLRDPYWRSMGRRI